LEDFDAACFTLFQAVPTQSGAWNGAYAPTCPFLAKGHAKADSQREKASVANVFEGSGHADCSARKSQCGIPVVRGFALSCRDQDAVQHLGPQQVRNRLGPFQAAKSGK